MLRNQNKIFIISLLIATSFISSYKLLIQTYDHRTAFAQLEKLTLEKEDLSFQSNILIEEVKYFNNQISLRKFASENLGMITPNIEERIYLTRRMTK